MKTAAVVETWGKVRWALVIVVLSLGVCVHGERVSYRDCGAERHNLRVEDSPIIVTGTVEKVDRHEKYEEFGAQIVIKRIIKRPPDTAHSGIVQQVQPGKSLRIYGFGSDDICDSMVRPRDSRIFLLKIAPNGRIELDQSLLRITVPNLERVTAVVRGEPYKRSVILDEPCEKKYCPYNADCKVNQRTGKAECECVTRCPVGYQPVCGSNGVTYPNDCQLRRESCAKKIKMYIKNQGVCVTSKS